MRSATAGWTPRERALLALCVAALGVSIAAYMDLGGSAGAAPGTGVGTSVSSGEIRNNTIRSQDIANGRVGARDMNLYLDEGFGSPATLGPNNFHHRFITCRDPGDRVLSGGYDGSTNLIPNGSYPIRAGTPTLDQWHFDFQTGNSPATVNWYIICLKR
jgi:hypothetical protein